MRLFITGGSGFIGTNVVDFYRQRPGTTILNYDIQSPLRSEHADLHHQGDIMDAAGLGRALQAFKPTHVLHLAARTDCVEDVDLATEYAVNIEGTQHVLDAVATYDRVERLIVTSSQYVCGPGHVPQNMEDYGPATVYGRSKVLTETKTRAADPPAVWTLVRPTNVWGPWHLRYQREAWRVMGRGLYLHPGGAPVVRCYAYVGTVVHYIDRIFSSPPADVHRQTFYLSDPPADIYDWANGFHRALTGKNARRVPRWILKSIGACGNLLGFCHLSFPLTLSRYRSMTSAYPTPVEQTYDVLGLPGTDLAAGIEETVSWLLQTETAALRD